MKPKNERINLFDPKLHSVVDEIIKNVCAKNDTENLEADIVALFEDIIKFFAGREEDFVKFDSMSDEQKEELYAEIKTIIDLLRKFQTSADKEEMLKILSKDLVFSFSKSSKYDVKQVMDEKEKKRLKEEFAKLSVAEIYNKQVRESKVDIKTRIEALGGSFAGKFKTSPEKNAQSHNASSSKGVSKY